MNRSAPASAVKSSPLSTRARQLFLAIGIALLLPMAATAAPITGTPVGSPFPWIPNSTDALDYAKQTPGRVGQTAPYVLFDTSGPGFVTLDFFNFATGLAFFETRIDGVETGTTAHPVVIGDTIHSGTAVTSGNEVIKTFLATSFVDIRLALGGERDWDFNWTRFAVGPAAVPEPDGLFLLIVGGVALALAGRRRATRQARS